MIEPQVVPAFRPPLYASPQRLFDGHLPPTAGPANIEWQERWLAHGEGDSQGKLVRLAPHQRFVLNRIYEYDPTTGALLYDRVVIGMPKGCSKTEDAARIGVGEVCGPSRPLLAPHVIFQAASYDQANNGYGAARAAIEEGPLASRFQTFDHELFPNVGGGIMRRMAARAGTSDGRLPTCAVGDELHEWRTDQQRRIYLVQSKNLRKRQVPRHGGLSGSLLISISSMTDDPDGLLGGLYAHGKRVAAGEILDPKLLFLWWEAPKAEDEDLDDPIQLRSAILAADPSVGHWRTLEQIEGAYHDQSIPNAKVEFERYNLNRQVDRPKAWLPEATWKAREALLGQPPDGTQIAIGFKGSYNRKATALVGWCVPQADPPQLAGVDDEEYASLLATTHQWDDYGFVIAVWEPDDEDPDWTVPRAAVDAELHAAMNRWRVIELACVPTGWVTEIEAWEQEYGERSVDTDDRVKGRGVVVRFDLIPGRFGPASDHFRAAVLDPKSGLRHDGSPDLTRHIRNADARQTRNGNMLEPNREKVIDLAPAAVIARHRALHQPKPRKRGIAAGF